MLVFVSLFFLFLDKISPSCGLTSLHPENFPNCPKIVTRSQWGARDAKKTVDRRIPTDNVVIHHTVTNSYSTESGCKNIMKSMQNYHMDVRNFNDIGYNFLVCGDLAIYEGAGWKTRGTHTSGYNSISLGLAFVGNFEENSPSDELLRVGQKFLECLVENRELSRNYKLFGARQVRNTLSPGQKLYDEIQKWPHFTDSPPKPDNSSDLIDVRMAV